MDRIVSPLQAAAAAFASAGLFVCAAQAAVVVPLPSHPDLQAVADRVHAFTVQVRATAFVTERTDGPLRMHEAVSFSSGVMVGEGLVLTTLSAVSLRGSDGHVQPADQLAVLVDDVGPLPARLLAGDTGLDVAVLQLPDQARTLAGASLAPEDPSAGDGMVALCVEGDSIRAVGLLLERIAPGDDARPRLQTDHVLPAPFWGGPLYDDRGQLAGIATRSTGANGSAVPASLLRALVRRSIGGSGT
jgi:S1-C subfamily serine protease